MNVVPTPIIAAHLSGGLVWTSLEDIKERLTFSRSAMKREDLIVVKCLSSTKQDFNIDTYNTECKYERLVIRCHLDDPSRCISHVNSRCKRGHNHHHVKTRGTLAYVYVSIRRRLFLLHAQMETKTNNSKADNVFKTTWHPDLLYVGNIYCCGQWVLLKNKDRMLLCG